MIFNVQILETLRSWTSLGVTEVKPNSHLGSTPSLILHGGSAIAHHPNTQPPCMQLSFLSFLTFWIPAVFLGRIWRLLYWRNHSSSCCGLCWSLCKGNLHFSLQSVPQERQQILSGYFRSKWLPSGGNESMALQPQVPFLWAADPG